jgi:hypothetical protein
MSSKLWWYEALALVLETDLEVGKLDEDDLLKDEDSTGSLVVM